MMYKFMELPDSTEITHSEMRPLSESQYAKTQGRRNLADLPFPEKVKCVIELQRRIQPIYAQRGIYIKPWRSWN